MSTDSSWNPFAFSRRDRRLQVGIDWLRIGPRAINALDRAKITTIGDITDVEKIPGVGTTTAQEIRQALLDLYERMSA